MHAAANLLDSLASRNKPAAWQDHPMTTYDEIPYESHPYQRTHPDHLATMAKLFGMTPPDVDRCRVLELGCAGGGNLIPMATSAPESTFVGVDLSQKQLAEGWRIVESLGLTNIQLQHRSILDVGPDDGQFDYIVCHGVFSWVPRDVQDKILEICKQNLAPNGVAYISYNTYPGWFMRGMVRDMMRYHASQFDGATAQVEQARALLDFLINAGPGQDETYHTLLRREAEILRNRQDSYLYHEHLEEDNQPLFFYQFMEQAENKGLRYLSETQFSEMVPRNVSPTVEATLRELKVGLIHSEQYLDFVRNRTFRRTLLCHADVELNRELGPPQLKGLYVGSPLKPTSPSAVNLTAHEGTEFRAPHGPKATVSQPLVKAAVLRLGEMWPQMIPFESLPSLAHGALDSVLVRDAKNYARDVEQLASLLLELYTTDLAELRVRPPRFQTKPGDRPLASALARWQAEQNGVVTNLQHDLIQLNDLDRRLLPKLDGTLDRNALYAILKKNVDDGELIIEKYSNPSTDGKAQDDKEFILALLDHGVERLARNALLLE